VSRVAPIDEMHYCPMWQGQVTEDDIRTVRWFRSNACTAVHPSASEVLTNGSRTSPLRSMLGCALRVYAI